MAFCVKKVSETILWHFDLLQIPSIYWWYKTTSHAAELTAGFYNPTNQDGYSPIFDMLKKHSVTLKFVCPGTQSSAQEHEAFADSEGLSWQVIANHCLFNAYLLVVVPVIHAWLCLLFQVLNSAWDRDLTVCGQNSLPCYDREMFVRILDTAKPKNNPDHRHLAFFTFQHLSPIFMQREMCLLELDNFIKSMHGMFLCSAYSTMFSVQSHLRNYRGADRVCWSMISLNHH